MSNDALIGRLSASLPPVRRRSVPRETGALIGLAGTELALFLAAGAVRSDMANAIQHPFMWWKLASLALIAAISGYTAIRSFSPTASPRSGLLLIGIVIGLTALAGAALDVDMTTGGSFASRLSPVHGLRCAAFIAALSLPMLGLLALLMRRGAPTHLEGSAVAVGLAAGSWGAFVFAFCCPANDPLYILVWYVAGCGAVTGVTRAILPKCFHL